ncbi:MAG: sulfate adenylyltransferase, partial [Bacteroidota bacterium]
AGSSVNITLEDDINITRGDMLVKTNELPKVEKEIDATVCWMDSKQLRPGAKYIVQHNTNKVLSKIDAVQNVMTTDFSGQIDSDNKLSLNEIGQVRIKLSKHIYYDAYKDNKFNGAFILVDAQTQATAGVGFIN